MTVRKNMCYCTFGYWMCENSAYTETFPVSICNSYKSPYKHGTTCIHSTLSLKKANPSTYCSLWAFPANPNLKKKKNKGRDKKSTPRNALPDWPRAVRPSIYFLLCCCLTPSTAQKLQFFSGDAVQHERKSSSLTLGDLWGTNRAMCSDSTVQYCFPSHIIFVMVHKGQLQWSGTLTLSQDFCKELENKILPATISL